MNKTKRIVPTICKIINVPEVSINIIYIISDIIVYTPISEDYTNLNKF